MSYYNNETKHIFIEIINEGFADIRLTDISINGDNRPQAANLGLSFTGRLVLGGIEDDPKSQFVSIDEVPISRKLSMDEIEQLINEENNNIPIHYGIQIINDEDIEDITIKYKYMGITKTIKSKFMCKFPQLDCAT
ncbi:hypothetical protein XYCOK13_34770 [Xylanibacillus composti]|uniref:Uncharacterized protein n=2 Tax=Xylanibacillus composti TaxID=1572762 RepID=A0A8J4H8J5_9BACL|nr:hypothetical protein XYCOK13_34770 [Xylanibacillus composti]